MKPAIKFLSKKKVRELTGKSDATLWRWEKAGLFPAFEPLGPNSVGLRQDIYDQWAENPQAWPEKYGKGGAA